MRLGGGGGWKSRRKRKKRRRLDRTKNYIGLERRLKDKVVLKRENLRSQKNVISRGGV